MLNNKQLTQTTKFIKKTFVCYRQVTYFCNRKVTNIDYGNKR